jgi:hypothetical protein
MKRTLFTTFDLTIAAIVFVVLLVASAGMRMRRLAQRLLRRQYLRLA